MTWLHWFAQPWALTLFAVLPLIGMLLIWARWRRQTAVRSLGSPFLIDGLLQVRWKRRRWRSCWLLTGLAALITGLAGPRWGSAAKTELLTGKDIVVVLDVSKSMLAEQPSRLERARRSLRDFAAMLDARGGHRVALVLFAARATLQSPLTSDYDHFRFAVEQVDAAEPPLSLRAPTGQKIASGTRMGAALAAAVAAHDPKRAGWRDILLLSDGDDPAGDDEWAAGVQLAHQANIPIHVVAIGDRGEPHPIRQGNELLRYEGGVVQSQLNEKLLQEIARRTGGVYVPAYLNALPLGRLLRGHLENRDGAADSATGSDEGHRFEAEPRYFWFLLAAWGLLSATLLLDDGPPSKQPRRAPWRPLAFALLALTLVSADTLPSVENLVRLGNAAFARQQYDDALRWYQQAQEHTVDPGLIAFNEAATLYRLGRFAEAAAHYERCLDDQLIPRQRQARANYDWGVALLQTNHQDRKGLEKAMAALRRCLEAAPSADLRADALHNLELAKWLWLRAKLSAAGEPNKPNEVMEDRPSESDPRGSKDAGASKKNERAGDADGDPEKSGANASEPGGPQKKLAHGPLQVLPDSAQRIRLSPEETAFHLERLIERMRRERLQHWRLTAPATHAKDW